MKDYFFQWVLIDPIDFSVILSLIPLCFSCQNTKTPMGWIPVPVSTDPKVIHTLKIDIVPNSPINMYAQPNIYIFPVGRGRQATARLRLTTAGTVEFP